MFLNTCFKQTLYYNDINSELSRKDSNLSEVLDKIHYPNWEWISFLSHMIRAITQLNLCMMLLMSTHIRISEICLILFYEAFTKRLSWDRQCLDAHIDIECCACSSASGFICTNERIYIRRRTYVLHGRWMSRPKEQQ